MGSNASDNMATYSYESLYNEELKQKLKFFWEINNYKGRLDKMRDVQFHSDVFYDCVQLKMSRGRFAVRIVGLPKNTHKMGVKFELFALDLSGKTDYNDNKIKIMSSIITFSYKSPTFFLIANQNDILMDLLSNHKRLILQCSANIIQKYDENNEIVLDQIEPIFAPKNQINEEDKEEKQEMIKDSDIEMKDIRKEIMLSQQKIIKLSSETFIWHITFDSDNNLLNKLNASIANKKNEIFHSEVFMLLGHKWYISIQTQLEETAGSRSRSPRYRTVERKNIVSFCVHGIIKGGIDCKVSYHLIQTGKKAQIYKSYDHSHGHWRRDVYLHDGQMLSEKVNVIKNLSEITLKVDIAIIADNSVDATIDDQEKNYINDEVARWLTDIVELPQYLQIFQQEAIENMSIVKLLNMEILTKMKIKKIGHQLKILHQIDLLKETETK